MTTRARRHKIDTKTFEELDFVGQAMSINAQIAILGHAIRANLRRAGQERRDTKIVRNTRTDQIERLRQRIAALNI
ncbi:MAG: hypothetical protein WBX38_14440 [Candidatus Sulfotelmatobacter sp.]